MAKLRLVKVLVQPVFVLDDGENVTELEHPAVAIPAAEWPTYSGERFPAEVREWEKQINAELSAAKPNRAARRAKKPKAPRKAG